MIHMDVLHTLRQLNLDSSHDDAADMYIATKQLPAHKHTANLSTQTHVIFYL